MTAIFFMLIPEVVSLSTSPSRRSFRRGRQRCSPGTSTARSRSASAPSASTDRTSPAGATQLEVFPLDLLVQFPYLFAVRRRRHPYIRIGLGRGHAGRFGRRTAGGGKVGLLRHHRLPPFELQRPFFALAHPPAPHLAQLVVAREELVHAKAARIVADLLPAQLVDEDVDVPPLLQRRRLLDAREELVVPVLQPPDV